MPDMTTMEDLAGRLAPAEVAVALPDGSTQLQILAVHPLAMLIPAMSEADEQRLHDDIMLCGVREPLIMFEGRVLDGRHRLRIAAKEGAVVRLADFSGDEKEARAYVWSVNVARRHLSVPQLAVAAERFGFIAEAKQSGGAHWPRVAARKTGGAITPASLRRFDAGRVAHAPRTMARIDGGIIRRMDRAVHEAAAELGVTPPEPVARTAFDRLGCARGDVLAAERTVAFGGELDPVRFAERAKEIQQALIRIDNILRQNNGKRLQ